MHLGLAQNAMDFQGQRSMVNARSPNNSPFTYVKGGYYVKDKVILRHENKVNENKVLSYCEGIVRH